MKKNRIALAIILVILVMTLVACGDTVDAGNDTNITITFMVDGEVYHEMEVKNDTTVRMPAEPQKDGFSFDGWYLSEDYEGVFTSSYLRKNTVVADITVYAKWVAEDGPGTGDQPPQGDGLVCFDANGGDVSIAEKRYEIGAVMTDMPIPTREGYDFVVWETASGESYTSASVMPDLDGETLYLYAEWKRQTSTYSDEYVQFSPAVEGIKNDDDFYLYYADKVDEYIYVELDIDYVGYGNAGKENNFRLGNWENLMFNTKEGCSLTWYTDSDFSRINGAQIFTLNYGSNIQFLTVTYQGIVRKTYLVDFYLLRDCYISLCDHIGGEPYTRVRIDEGGTFDQNYEWRLADKFEGDKRVYYNTSTRRYETFDYSTIINQDWTLYQTYVSKEITYLDADGESKTLEIKPFEDVKLSTPSKEGYTFIGWQQPDKKMFTDIEGASRLQLTEDNYFETLTPIWEEDVFVKIDTVNSTKFELATPTVLYDNNGGLYKLVYYNQDNEICYSKQYSIKIRYDLFIWGGDSFNEFYTTTLTCPNVPGSYNLDSSMAEMIFGNSSYTTVYFAGWYTGQLGGGEKFDFTAPIYGDVTLYALMLPEDNSDAYENEPSGGQCHIPEPTKTDKAYFSGEEATLTAMENPGYTWVGWYDGDTELTAEESYKVTVPAEDKTYTAKWVEYYVSVENNIEDAGRCGIGEKGSITFNLNGGSGTTAYPTRSGYAFAGWYDNKSCTGSPYDFTNDITEEITLYAKWISHLGTGALNINSSKSISVVSQSSSTQHYYAFVPLADGQIIVYTAGSLDTCGYLYNSSKSKLTYNDDDGEGNNFSITYNVTAGTLYYIRPCGYSSSGTTTIYLLGNMPEDGGEITNPSTKRITAGETDTLTATTNAGYTWLGWYDGDTLLTNNLTYTFTMPAENKTYTAKWVYYTVSTDTNITSAGTYTSKIDEKVTVGEAVSLTATTNPGYTWLGWFDGDTKVGDDLTFTFTMPADNKTYTAKWTISDEMSNFNFVASSDGFTITGIKDKTVTSIVVPDYVTEISAGAFSGCSALESITIPFVGAKLGVTNSDTYQYPFGYIFGTSSYTGGKAVTQYYYGSSTTSTTGSTYYIPSSLRNVTVTGGNILHGAFQSCSMLTDISIPDSVTTIRNSAFNCCSSLTSITIPDSVTTIDHNAFNGCSGLTSITIPARVTSIGNAAFINCTSLMSITIPARVTSIGNAAFEKCTSLTSVTFDNNSQLTTIDSYAFANCTSLTSITIPSSVTDIEPYCFYQCTSLTSVYYGGTEARWASILINTYNTPFKNATRYYYSECIHDSNHWRYDSDGNISTELTISDWIVDVEATCTTTGTRHKECTICHTPLETEVIPAGHTLGEAVVENNVDVTCTTEGSYDLVVYCTTCEEEVSRETVIADKATGHTLGEAVVENNVDVTCTTDGSYDLVKYCTTCGEEVSRETATVDATGHTSGEAVVENIVDATCTTDGSYDLVKYCTTCGEELSRETITVEATGHTESDWIIDKISCTEDGSRHKECAVCHITLETEVITAGHDYVETVVLPTATEQGYTLHQCSRCEENYKDNYVDALEYAEGLAYSVNADGQTCTITDIGSCTKTAFAIPEEIDGYAVTSIGDNALSGSEYITNIIIPDSVTSIGEYAFFNSGLTRIVIPDSVASIGRAAFANCSSLEKVIISDIASWCKIAFDDASANPLGYATHLYIGNAEVTEIIIPDTITKINPNAFCGFSNLTSITIPDSVTSIGEYAFYGCTGLTSLTIPDSVTSIGSEAFHNCSSITTVTFEKKSQLTSIGERAFEYCASLTNITIPAGVVYIGEYAFQDCALTSIVIPSSVTSIGSGAFYTLYGLTSISFEDTSTWYRTTDYSEWSNKTGGTQTCMTDASANASYFRYEYPGCYWYKL